MANWTVLAAAGNFTQQPGTVAAPWFPVMETLAGIPSLRIKATGSWNAIAGMLPGCGPDGVAGLVFDSTQLMLAGCPAGALLGKFGGSSASYVPPPAGSTAIAEGQPFAIGSYCVVKVPDNTLGPLFVGFNIVHRPVEVTAALTLEFAKLE